MRHLQIPGQPEVNATEVNASKVNATKVDPGEVNPSEDTGCAVILAGCAPAAFMRPGLVTRRRSRQASFARHVLIFSFANLVSLVCNGFLSFLLPRWLSMEHYGYYRLFILYGGFSGILHLGLSDGALIRWAARSRQRMQAGIYHGLVFLLLQHLALLAPAVVILFLWFRHQPWFFLVWATMLYAVIWNTALLGQFALQADKSFGLLSVVTIIQPALSLGIVIALNHWKHLTLETLLGAFIGAWLLAGIAIWGILLARYPGKMRSAGQVWQTGAYNICAGWSIMLAGLLTNLALSLDRFVVSLSFSIRDFAIYSLAATALAVVNSIILSVSRVVFPYLSDGLNLEKRRRAYDWGESCLLTLWAISLAGYFPLRALIEGSLPAYLLSLPILRVLMLATGLTAMIYILHANYFRSGLRQGRLLLGASAGLLAAALFLALARPGGRLVNMSWAMLAAIAWWWVVDELLLREQTHRTLVEIGRALGFVAACGGSFLLCASISGNWLGLVIYTSAAALLVALGYGRTLHSLPRLKLLSLFDPGS
jgi:O-antigen/teichoic acid export membrane protein